MENKAVIINKCDIIDNSLKRVYEEYDNKPSNLNDYRINDCIVLNIQRACEAAIDIAMYIISTRKLGVPQTKKEAFEKLNQHNIIDDEMCKNMKNMTSFRNIAVHDYRGIDEEILIDVIENHLKELKEFATQMLNL